MPRVAAGLGALLLLGGAGFALTSALGDDRADAGTSTGTSSPNSGAGGSASTSDSTGSASSGSTGSAAGSTAGVSGSNGASASESSASESAAADEAATKALDACVAEVRAGEALVKAADASARDWGVHAGAQIDLDRGKISYERASQLWAKTKVKADADVAAFNAAKKTYDARAGQCADAPSATAGSAQADAAKACSARASALATVVGAGEHVNHQWHDHSEQMKTKDRDAGPAYHAKWLDYVEGSKRVLGAYATAKKSLAAAPACEG